VGARSVRRMLTTTRIDDLVERGADDLGASDWMLITQETIYAFAAATGDQVGDKVRMRVTREAADRSRRCRASRATRTSAEA
jgi:hypothetical protein